MKFTNVTTKSLVVFALMTAGNLMLAPILTASPGFAATDSKHPGKNNLEQRIHHLHDVLKITPDEETLWAGVAQAMTGNSNAIDSAIGDRMQKAGQMNAVDDMNSYQAIAASHADGLKNLANMFAKLYAVMPEAQKKTGDTVFGHRTASKLKTEQHS